MKILQCLLSHAPSRSNKNMARARTPKHQHASLPKYLYTVKPRYTVQLGSRGFERYAVWKRYIASSLINRCKGLNQLFSLSITT